VDAAKLMRDLGSADAAVRLKASKQLESELRKAATEQRKKHFGNKAATSLLMAALDDPDPKVVHNAVVAFAQIARHYFKDDRAYAKLLDLAYGKQPVTARWAIDALLHLRGEASLGDALPLCTSPSPEARAAVFDRLPGWLAAMSAAHSGSVRPESRDRLRAAALGALGDDDRTVRGNAAALLGEVGDASALSALRKSLKKESYWLNEQIIGKAIARLDGRS
jgi:HEAT repeat protein